jgi:hypothetical protein
MKLFVIATGFKLTLAIGARKEIWIGSLILGGYPGP